MSNFGIANTNGGDDFTGKHRLKNADKGAKMIAMETQQHVRNASHSFNQG